MLRAVRLLAFAGCVAVAGITAGCDDDTRTITETVFRDTGSVRTVTDTVRFGEFRIFNQIERLGAPLFAEAFLDKRDHDFHDAGTPNTDSTNFVPKVVKFITTVAGRDAGYAKAVADALVPDMIVLQLDKAPATAGYLGQILDPATNYGGRRLPDDVVDLSLMVVFGNALGNNNSVSPGLTTDNVPSDSPFLTTFPFLAPANASLLARRSR
ncbi:MAG: DUF4331 family protein [Anaerolineae bacterium]|nr:DUF4331 family protein [Gemmatimonadaceae bacterium]